MSIAISAPFTPPDLRTYRAVAVNLAALGDQYVFTGLPSTPFRVVSMVIWNHSATPGLLTAFHLRDSSGGLGNSLLGPIAGMNAYLGIAALGLEIPISNSAMFSNRVFPGETSLYFRVTVANATALTANVNITVSVL